MRSRDQKKQFLRQHSRPLKRCGDTLLDASRSHNADHTGRAVRIVDDATAGIRGRGDIRRRKALDLTESFVVGKEEGLILLDGPPKDAPNWLR